MLSCRKNKYERLYKALIVANKNNNIMRVSNKHVATASKMRVKNLSVNMYNEFSNVSFIKKKKIKLS